MTVDKLHKKCDKFVKSHIVLFFFIKSINDLIDRNELEFDDSSEEEDEDKIYNIMEIEEESNQDRDEILLKM